MPNKKNPNTDFMVNYVKDFISGKTERFAFDLDFNHHFTERYAKMEHEYPEFADAFYCCIVESGVERSESLSDSQYKNLIKKQLNELFAIEADGFF
jgi:hypothetical protein